MALAVIVATRGLPDPAAVREEAAGAGADGALAEEAELVEAA